MLGKLLKYDMRRSLRVGGPLLIAAVVIIIIGFSCGLLSCFLQDFMYGDLLWGEPEPAPAPTPGEEVVVQDPPKIIMLAIVIIGITLQLFMLLLNLINSVSSMVLPILVVVIFIINLINFYISLMTDEGYLTFTLPVRSGTLLFSKYLNAAFWNILMGLTAVFGSLVISLPNNLYSILKTISDVGFKPFFNTLGAIINFKNGINPLNLILLLCLAGIVSMLAILAQQSFFFFTIFLGGVVAKKRKLLAGAGFTILGYIIFYYAERFIAWIVMIFCFTPLFFINNLGGAFVTNLIFIILNLILFISIWLLLIVAIGFFFLTKLLAKRCLNLP